MPEHPSAFSVSEYSIDNERPKYYINNSRGYLNTRMTLYELRGY